MATRPIHDHDPSPGLEITPDNVIDISAKKAETTEGFFRNATVKVGTVVLATALAAGSIWGLTKSKETNAAPGAQEPVATAPVVPGTSETTVVAEVPVKDDGKTHEVIPSVEAKEISGVILDGKVSQLESIYQSIDWNTQEDTLATAPAPMFVEPNEDGKYNAQDFVDAWTFNSSIWNATNDPRYGAAMIGETDTSNTGDSSYYMNRGLDGGFYVKVEQWAQAFDIDELENGDIAITGQGVIFGEEVGVEGVEIAEFSMRLHVEETSGKVTPISFAWSEENLYEAFNQGGGARYTTQYGEIVLPWTH